MAYMTFGHYNLCDKFSEKGDKSPYKCLIDHLLIDLLSSNF